MERILAHMDTVVLVHRQKHLRLWDYRAIDNLFIWLEDPRGSPEPIGGEAAAPNACTAADLTPESPSDQGIPPHGLPEGYDDADIAA
jgi:hypothetical protein